MFCAGCGAKSTAADQKFCDNCGTMLRSTATQGAPAAPSFPPGPTGQQYPQQPVYSAPPQPGYAGGPAAAPQYGGPASYGDPGRISSLNFIQAIKYCFTRYFVVNGRGVRSEYWYFTLGYIIYVRIVEALFWDPFDNTLVLLLELAWFIPSIPAAVRRMHDVGKSGWYLLIPIYDLILLCTESDAGPNQYGDPVDYRGLV